MCFLHPRKHPTHSGHPTHPHDQRAFGEARDRWEHRQNISWHAISYRSKVEAGEKRESCWKILNPSGTFFRKEIGSMCTRVFIQSSECSFAQQTLNALGITGILDYYGVNLFCASKGTSKKKPTNLHIYSCKTVVLLELVSSKYSLLRKKYPG